MKREIAVYLGHEARRVGTLYYEGVGARARVAFAYEESWRVTPDRFALEPWLPLVAGVQFHYQCG